MGTVYLARHAFMGRKVAVKLLRPELTRDPALVTRFMNEARATNAIGHPNIIDIIDVGMLPDGCTPYLMMELLQGESLCQRLQRERRLPIREAVEIAAQTASALAAAHACEIVHRDLKPDNVFLVPDQTLQPLRLRVKVLDFGIAKLLGDISDGSVKTRTGAIMGTPQYMSPEQCRGLTQGIDHRTDVYALGCMLYEMLCGAPPFVSEGLGDMIMMHLEKAPIPPRTRNGDVPDGLEKVILRALAKRPDGRFNTMAELERALRPTDPQAAPTVRQAPLPRAAAPSSAAGEPQPAAVEDTLAVAPTEIPAVASPTPPIASPTGSVVGSWLRAPSTTFTSMAGQVIEDQAGRRRRRTLWLGGGLGLVGAATATVGAIFLSGTPRSPGSSPVVVPMVAPRLEPPVATRAGPVAEPLPIVPTAVDPSPPPTAASSVESQKPRSPIAKAHLSKGAKKSAATPLPAPFPAPITTSPSPPVMPAERAIKPGDKW